MTAVDEQYCRRKVAQSGHLVIIIIIIVIVII